MKRFGVWMGLGILGCVLSITVAAAGGDTAALAQQRGGGAGGWNVPQTASSEKNPLTVNDTLLAAGKKLFADKCARCHGVRGKGDGPEGDESHQEDMDLTVAARASRNPDGVVFYKIWNGRPNVKMDAMSGVLTKDQVWSVVAYVQTMRAKAGSRP